MSPASFRPWDDSVTTNINIEVRHPGRSAERLSRLLLSLHLATVTLVLLVLAVAPPAHGQFLLLPLSAKAGERLAADALERGGRLLGAGPVAGSIVVWGDRDVVTKGLIERGVVTIAAPDFLCGASR